MPTAKGVQSFAEENGLSVEELVFQGGEEYAIVGTIPKRKVAGARNAVHGAGGVLLEIGKATDEPRRIVLNTGGTRKQIRDVGWTHLR
jgi:thiamine monophosphate kinase